MQIRKSKREDLPTLMSIFAFARAFMAKTGNAYQWGHNQWPPQEVIEGDIQIGKGYVIEEQGEIVGTFFLDFGENPDPCYDVVEEGAWSCPGPYAVIHRIASSGKAHGILNAAVEFALTKVNQVRIDTHEDNVVMRGALTKIGFRPIGYIYVTQDTVRRIAYELIRD